MEQELIKLLKKTLKDYFRLNSNINQIIHNKNLYEDMNKIIKYLEKNDGTRINRQDEN